MTGDTSGFRWGVVCVAALAVAVIDVRSRRMPNAITAPLWLVGLIFAGWQSGWSGLGEAFLASIVVAAPFVLLFLFGGGGAGDAKFMAALGAWLGLRHGIVVLLAVAVAGLLLAAVKAVLARRLRSVLLSGYGSAIIVLLWFFGRRTGPENQEPAELLSCGLTVPYGVAILAGVGMALAFCWFCWGSLYETPL